MEVRFGVVLFAYIWTEQAEEYELKLNRSFWEFLAISDILHS